MSTVNDRRSWWTVAVTPKKHRHIGNAHAARSSTTTVSANPTYHCRNNTDEKALKVDCTAHSIDKVVKKYPTMPGGEPRCFPSTRSAVLLPLKNLQAPYVEAEVFVCGGAPKGIMGDMILLPNGNVLIINGVGAGVAGWEINRNPVLNPVLYRPDDKIGSRFKSQNPATIPRMYHSTAVLLRDGRVLVGGSNPHKRYNFTGVLFPTDLSLEAFSLVYLDPENSVLRPKIVLTASQAKLKYKQNLEVRFTVVAGNATLDKQGTLRCGIQGIFSERAGH
ncbi:hypothetical protein QYF36_010235 [Acer negundo]|nr:hypothetical protein QYF36_010235 [Acer negundo]